MASTFADVEARVASSGLRLANADALFEGAVDTVQVVFDAAAQRSDVGAMGVVSTSPAIALRTVDVPSAPEGKTVIVRGLQYLVDLHEPDGTGWSMLYLTGGTQ